MKINIILLMAVIAITSCSKNQCVECTINAEHLSGCGGFASNGWEVVATERTDEGCGLTKSEAEDVIDSVEGVVTVSDCDRVVTKCTSYKE